MGSFGPNARQTRSRSSPHKAAKRWHRSTRTEHVFASHCPISDRNHVMCFLRFDLNEQTVAPADWSIALSDMAEQLASTLSPHELYWPGLSNFESSTRTFSLISANARVIGRLPRSTLETVIINGSFRPSTSR